MSAKPTKQRDACIYYPSGDFEAIYPANGKSFTLAEMQKAVEGLVEMVRFSRKGFLLVNERGRLLRMAFNLHASSIAGMLIVGPAVYIPRRSLFP